MGIFIALNIFLTLVALLAIIILYVRQNQYHQLEKKYEKLNNELEEQLTSFFITIKEENEAFLEKYLQIHSSPQRTTDQIVIKQADDNETKQNSNPPLYGEIEKNDLLKHINTEETIDTLTNNQSFSAYSAKKAYKIYSEKLDPLKVDTESAEKTNEIDSVIDNNENSLEKSSNNEQLDKKANPMEQINELLEKGLSVEDIAKNLDLGKTEVELMIKFNQEK